LQNCSCTDKRYHHLWHIELRILLFGFCCNATGKQDQDVNGNFGDETVRLFQTGRFVYKLIISNIFSVAKKLKLIFNPAARGGKSEQIAQEVKSYLDQEGVDYAFVKTQAPLDAIKLAATAKKEGFDTVCSIGGDGTAHEVANGAIKSGVTFGIIPAGSGNDFSKGIGLRGNWEEAIETVLYGTETSISATKINDRYSINIVDSGLGGVVAKKSLESLRWMKGSMKYTLLMIRALLSHKPYPCTVILDGDEFEFDINILAAGFGQSFGSGMLILPEARFTDDEMSIAVINNASRLTILRVFPKVFSGSHITYDKYVTMLRGKHLKIIPHQAEDRNMLSQAEGELVGTAPITFEAVPKALKVMIPNEWDLDKASLWNKDAHQ